MNYILRLFGFDRRVKSTPTEANPESTAKFLLNYGNILVGILTVEKGIWKFEYSEEFKNQEDLRPILELPDVQKAYQSSYLWQFFAMRIPSLEQPEIEAILQREHIDNDDAVRLLQRFGKRTIANPYELKAA